MPSSTPARPGPARPGPTRIASLDTLRGVAILLVLLSHYVPVRLPLGDAAYAVAGLGRAGVMLFFLLSGYLIFRTVERHPLPVFLSRRLFKILPAYWVNVAVLLLLDVGGGVGVDVGGGAAGHFPASSYVASALMVADVARVDAVSGVYWTLFIEIKFYLVTAVHYAALRGRGIPAILLGLVALNAGVWILLGHGSQLLTCFPLFYVGAEIHRAEQAGWSRAASRRLGAVVGALSLALAVLADQYPVWSAFYLLLGAALFVAALRGRVSSAAMGFLGRTSYSNYLYHSTIGAALFAALGPAVSPLGGIASILAAFAAATVAATLLYHLVEEPMVRLGRRFDGAWQALAYRTAVERREA